MKKILLSLLVSLSLFAQTNEVKVIEKPENKEIVNIGEITVKGDVIDSVSSTEEVTKEELLQQKNTNTKEILDKNPLIYFNIGARNDATLTLRGFSNRQVPVLINGIPIYMPYSGDFDVSKIAGNFIDKIEVSTGISSAVYGPNTMGGVVNIVTSRPTKEGFSSFVFAEGGLEKQFTVGANLSYSLYGFYISIMPQIWKSDGFYVGGDKEDKKDGTTLLSDGDLRNNSERSGESVVLTTGYNFNKGNTIELSYYYLNEDKQLPIELNNSKPKYWRFPEWSKHNIILSSINKVNENISMKTKVFYDSYYNKLESFKADDFKELGYDSIYDDYSYGAIFNPKFTFFKTNNVSFLAYYKKDLHSQGETGGEFKDYKGNTYSFASEYSGEFDKISLLASISYDGNYLLNQNKLRTISSINPQGGITYLINEELNIYASFAKKTRFPTLKELFSGYIDSNKPNPDLIEETAYNSEIGVKSENSLGNVKFAVFYSSVDDLIENIVLDELNPQGKPYKQLQNIGDVQMKGVDLTFKTKYFANIVSLSGGYVFMKSESDRFDHVLFRPKHTFKLAVNTKLFGFGELFLFGQYIGEQYEMNTKNEYLTIDGYFLIDAKYEFEINGFSTYLKVNNILNKYYETQNNYPLTGRTIILGVSHKY